MIRHVLVVLAVVLMIGCLKVAQSPLPDDVKAEQDCIVAAVEGGQTRVDAILVTCIGSELKIVLDTFELLLSSQSWTKAHPDLAAKLLPEFTAGKARLAAQQGASKTP